MNPKALEAADRLEAKFVGLIERQEAIDQPTVLVPKDALLAVLEYLRDEEGCALLLDVCAVDYFPARPRFELVYHCYDPVRSLRLRVKTRVGLGERVKSATAVYPGANWPEREAYDLFGIAFEGHPNLTRIYLPDDWEGHPLRKDYPLTGKRID